ncbi:MAG: hypothetical protein GBAus27B_000603 [Mycoplasmataceae bacterium]|nr:MAG: hypothetical protein GBAus27B_000603 [Mycoplasmataceae bacterium]
MTTTKKNELKATENKLNLYQRIQLIQSEVQELVRSEENIFQKYWYFDELQVLRHLKPLLDQHQLTLLISDDESKDFLVEQHGNMWLVKYSKKCELIASDNPSERLIHYFLSFGVESRSR